MSRLLHYSREPLTKKRDAHQAPDNRFKPQGLWVSVEGEYDWRSWCESEDFGSYSWQTEIALTGRDKPIMMLGPKDLDAFTDKYAKDRRSYDVNWWKIAADHSGIIIAPYSWQHRLALSWYYPWDCASGCLWSVGAWEIAAPSIPVEFRKAEVA